MVDFAAEDVLVAVGSVVVVVGFVAVVGLLVALEPEQLGADCCFAVVVDC